MVEITDRSASLMQTREFNTRHRIEAHEVIRPGYRDGGRSVHFDDNRQPIGFTPREIIVVRSPADDPELAKAIATARSSVQHMTSTEEKVKYLNALVGQLLPENNPTSNREIMSRLVGGEYEGSQIMLGDFIGARTGVCRHRSLLFKIIADAVGVPTALVRGNFNDSNVAGGHVWNEVPLENGQMLVVDPQNAFVTDLNNPFLQNYRDVDDRPIYAAQTVEPAIAPTSHYEPDDRSDVIRKIFKPDRIERIRTDSGYSIMIRSTYEEARIMQRELRGAHISAVVEGPNSAFGLGLRIRSESVEAVEALIYHPLPTLDAAPAEERPITGLFTSSGATSETYSAHTTDAPERVVSSEPTASADNGIRNRLIARDGNAGRVDSSMMSNRNRRGPGGLRDRGNFSDDFASRDAHRPLDSLPHRDPSPLYDTPATGMSTASRTAPAGDAVATTGAPESRPGTSTTTQPRPAGQINVETAPVDGAGPAITSTEATHGGNTLTARTTSPVPRTGAATDVVPAPKLEPIVASLEQSVAPFAEGEIAGSRLAGVAGKFGAVGMAVLPGVVGLATRRDSETLLNAAGRGYTDAIGGIVMTPLKAAQDHDFELYIASLADNTGIPASAILQESRIQNAAAALPQAKVDAFLPEIKGNPNLGSKDEQLNHISKLIYEREQGYPNLELDSNNHILGPTKDTKPLVKAIAATGGRENAGYTYTIPISDEINLEVRRYMATGGNSETMRETLEPAYLRERNFERLRNLVPDTTYSAGPDVEAINGNVALQKFKDGIQAGDDRTPRGKETLMKLSDEYYAAYPDDRQTALQFASRSMSRGTTLGTTVPNTQQLIEAGLGPLIGLSGKPEDAGADKAKLDAFIVKDDFYKKLKPNADYTIDVAEIYSKLSQAQQAQVSAERTRMQTVTTTTAPAQDAALAPVVATATPEAQPEEIVVTGSRYEPGTANNKIPESVRQLIDRAGLATWMDQNGDGKITMREVHRRMEQAGVSAGYDKIDTDELKAKLPKLQALAEQNGVRGRA